MYNNPYGKPAAESQPPIPKNSYCLADYQFEFDADSDSDAQSHSITSTDPNNETLSVYMSVELPLVAKQRLALMTCKKWNVAALENYRHPCRAPDVTMRSNDSSAKPFLKLVPFLAFGTATVAALCMDL
jgi:hypothetical protein